jgi:hypothetical protein
MESEDHEAFLRLGDQDVGNLRTAIDWAFANGHPHLGLEISRNLWHYFSAREMHHARRYIRTGLELIDDDTPAVLEAASLSLIDESSNLDPEFQAATRARVELGLESCDDPTLKSTLLRGLASSFSETDPRTAERYLVAAAALRPVPPITTLAALHNRCTDAWVSGRIDDADAVLERLEEVISEFPAYAASGRGIKAMVAATTGRWDDVVRLAAVPDELDQFTEFAIRTAQIEALIALGRAHEASEVLRQVKADSEEQGTWMGFLEAPIDLATGNPTAAVEALRPLVESIGRDPRRLATSVPAASMLAVGASDLGQHETAAVLFGFSIAERQRLDITLRLVDRPFAERAIAACRAELGDERFEELAAEGAAIEFRDLPRVET